MRPASAGRVAPGDAAHGLRLRRAAIAALLPAAAWLGGCVDPFAAAPPPPPPPAAPDAAAPAAGQQMAMEEINLYIHDNRPTAGGAERKPLFMLHAGRYTMDGPVWVVEGARAVIYGHGEGSSDLVLEAARGRFDEGKGALLSGGVKAFMGDLTLEMAEVRCDIVEDDAAGGVSSASSEGPVIIAGDRIKVEAGGVRLLPETRELEMTDVHGDFIRFGSTL